jgi:excinuclease UvrABC ATPase subunit
MAGALQHVGGDRATLEVIKTADWIIGLIPAGGDGEIIAAGSP